MYKKAYEQARKKMGRPPGRSPAQAVAALADGPPGRLEDTPRRNIIELLKIANVNRGDCLHCGVTGHMMYNEACALRGKPVMDQACRRCNKGLHSADDCPKPYQARPMNASQAQYYQALYDNLNEI
jgi:hypothetical protein